MHLLVLEWSGRERTIRTSINSKQRPNTIKLRRENLQDNKTERELTESSADVGAFKGALRGTDLDESARVSVR